MRIVHKHIFQDIYEWAGKDRTVNFSKRDPGEPWWQSVFAPHDQIALIAQSITDDLKAWNNLKGLGHAEFTTKLAAVYAKVNYLHPFAEGNGRSAQTLLSQLAFEAGYRLDFDKVNPKDWNVGAARSMPQVNVRERAVKRAEDVSLILHVFREVTTPTRTKQIENAIRQAIAPFRGRETGRDR